MSTVALVDTSVLCNLLKVPGFNERAEEAIETLESYLQAKVALLLPVATILETGNHIGQVKGKSGQARREAADRFVQQVTLALDGEAPWTVTPLDEIDARLRQAADAFVELATRRVGIGDATIIALWEETCARFPHRRVFIWSYDEDLQGYDAGPS